MEENKILENFFHLKIYFLLGLFNLILLTLRIFAESSLEISCHLLHKNRLAGIFAMSLDLIVVAASLLWLVQTRENKQQARKFLTLFQFRCCQKCTWSVFVKN